MKRVFIIGSPRSGTTWTALILAQHPEIQACQQIGAVSTLHKFQLFWRRGEEHTRYHSSAIQFGSGEVEGKAKPVYKPLMTREQMLQTCTTMLDQVYGYAEAMRPGCKAIVDSTPENALFAPLMAELMPDAYYLHIVRDPRAVFASHRKATEDFGARFPTEPGASAEFWKKHVLRARELKDLVPNYRELRYESLKSSGVAELMALLQWIGLTADEGWCERVLANTSVSKLQGTPGTPNSFFRSGNAAGWRDELKPEELHEVEFHARDLMIELGYEPVLSNSDQKSTRMKARDRLHQMLSKVRSVSGLATD